VPRTPIHTGGRPRPLILTSDVGLLDELLRLAAAGSVEVTVADDPDLAADGWSLAPFVLVGADCAARCESVALPARSNVILVVRSGQPPPPWAHVEAVRAEHVAVLPEAQTWLVDRFADHLAGTPDRARVVALVGGSGGVGTSVLATALAVTAGRRGLDTLLIDGDPLGGGVDLALGWEHLEGLRWPDLAEASGRATPALVDALPRAGSLAVLSFDRTDLRAVPAEAMAAALDAGRRGRDLVLVDLPRSFDDASLLALTAAERCYVVVLAELRACAAARRVATTAARHCPALAVVVRTPAPTGIRPSEVAEALDLPLVGVLPQDANLARRMAAGASPGGRTGRGPLAQLCGRLLADIAPRRRAALR
jgi:secretion/DNA translocation related CpaE-like protein